MLWDEQCRNTERYGVTAWPVAYLIGTDGRVVWEGNPQRVISRRKPRQQLLALVEAELAKVANVTGQSKELERPVAASTQSKEP